MVVGLFAINVMSEIEPNKLLIQKDGTKLGDGDGAPHVGLKDAGAPKMSVGQKGMGSGSILFILGSILFILFSHNFKSSSRNKSAYSLITFWSK